MPISIIFTLYFIVYGSRYSFGVIRFRTAGLIMFAFPELQHGRQKRRRQHLDLFIGDGGFILKYFRSGHILM